MKETTRRAVGLTTAAALTLGLASCALSEDFSERISAEILASDTTITDVYVTNGHGVAGVSPYVRIYISTVDPDTLATTMDTALRAILIGSPERPARFTFDVAEGAKPEQVSLGRGAYPIEDAAKSVGLYEHYQDNLLTGTTDDLEARYGSWEELHK